MCKSFTSANTKIKVIITKLPKLNSSKLPGLILLNKGVSDLKACLNYCEESEKSCENLKPV